MQSLEEKDSMELGSAGQVEDLAYNPIHRCPVCGQMARCFTVDGFHNCNLLWINLAGLADTWPTIVGESPFVSESRACNPCYRSSVIHSASPQDSYFFFLLA